MIQALALGCAMVGAVEHPASSLNCLTLFPTPDLAVSGTIALRPVASPFGVGVTVDGRPRYHLVADIAGFDRLPECHRVERSVDDFHGLSLPSLVLARYLN